MRKPSAELRSTWAKRVERWKDSGLTAREFAAEIGVEPGALTNWKWKLRIEQGKSRCGVAAPIMRLVDRPAPKTAESAAPKTAESAAPSPLELVFANGVVMRVATGFDEATLLRVVDLLGARRLED